MHYFVGKLQQAVVFLEEMFPISLGSLPPVHFLNKRGISYF